MAIVLISRLIAVALLAVAVWAIVKVWRDGRRKR